MADVLAAVCIAALPQLAYFRAFELPPLQHLESYRTYVLIALFVTLCCCCCFASSHLLTHTRGSTLFARPAISRVSYSSSEWRASLRKAIPRLSIVRVPSLSLSLSSPCLL